MNKTKTEEFLYTITGDSLPRIEEVVKDVDLTRIFKTSWKFPIGMSSYLFIENIHNDLMNINIKTNSHNYDENKQLFVKNYSIVVPVNEIHNFIRDTMDKINYKNNTDFSNLVSDAQYYINLLEDTLKGKIVKIFNVNVEEESKYRKNILLSFEIKGKQKLTHYISCEYKSDKGLLSSIEVNANFIIPSPDDKDRFFTGNYKKQIALTNVEDYPLLNSLYKNKVIKEEQSLNSIINNIVKESSDNELLKTVSYYQLNENLPTENTKKIVHKI